MDKVSTFVGLFLLGAPIEMGTEVVRACPYSILYVLLFVSLTSKCVCATAAQRYRPLDLKDLGENEFFPIALHPFLKKITSPV